MSTKEIRVGKMNNIFQHIIVLKTNRTKRFESKEIFVEGVRNINLALKYGWKVKNWIYANYNELSNWAKQTIEKNITSVNYSFSKDLISQISSKTDTSELMAVFEMKFSKVEPVKNKTAPLFVLFDRPSKKGNLGSIIRSADAFGVDGIIVTGHAVDIYDPEVIGASMGSYFTMPIEKIDTNNAVVEKIVNLKKDYPNLQVIATTELGTDDIRAIDYKLPTIIMIGNESMGLSKFLLDISDKSVQIPMVGEASSFNAACAGSIFIYEAFMNRRK